MTVAHYRRKTLSCWRVDTSHSVSVPKYFEVTSLEELKRKIVKVADGKKRKPIIGLLEYSHVIRDGQEMLLVHFRHHETNKKLRFMRLIRETADAVH